MTVIWKFLMQLLMNWQKQHHASLKYITKAVTDHLTPMQSLLRSPRWSLTFNSFLRRFYELGVLIAVFFFILEKFFCPWIARLNVFPILDESYSSIQPLSWLHRYFLTFFSEASLRIFLNSFFEFLNRGKGLEIIFSENFLASCFLWFLEHASDDWWPWL